MNVATVPTRRLTGLDYRIWLVTALCWVVCAGWFVYKNLIPTNAANCGALQITVNSDGTNRIAVCKLDETSFFQIDAPPNAQVEWNFGDGTKATGDKLVGHKFNDEDDYTVTATVNGLCETKREITVKKATAEDVVKPLVKIFADTGRTVGSRIRFSVVTNVPIDSCRWRVLPSNETQVGENVAFNFPRAGTFIVQATVNNDPALRQEQTITIADLPLPSSIIPNPGALPSGAGGSNPGGTIPPLFPQGDPANGGQKLPVQNTGAGNGNAASEPPKTEQAKPKATGIDPDGFKSLLQEVLDGSKELTDLYPFLDYTGSTKVIVNGKDEMKITDFIREKRKKKIEALEFQKDDKNGIQKIKLKLKKGLFNIFK